MKTILTIVVLIIAYGVTRLVIWYVFGTVRVAFKRRKIAKLDRLDRMDNGNRLRTYFLEMDAAKQEILDRWPGQFPPGDEGKLVQQLAWDSLMCIEQNPRVMKSESSAATEAGGANPPKRQLNGNTG